MTNISALMKSKMHYIKIIIIKKEVVSYCYTCKFRSSVNVKTGIVYIHILLVLYILMILHYYGLSHHILIKLSKFWSIDLERIIE